MTDALPIKPQGLIRHQTTTNHKNITTMKKVILIAACLLSLTTVNAQEKGRTEKTGSSKAHATPEQRAQKNVDAIASEITLTEDQKPKIYELALAKVKKVDEIKAKYKGDEKNEAKGTELRTVKKDFQQSVKALLTPDQIEKFKAAQKEKRAAGKETAIEAE